MDPSCQSEDLQVGSKVEFPLWLADALKNLQNPAVNIDIPNIYKEGYRFDFYIFIRFSTICYLIKSLQTLSCVYIYLHHLCF